jgi:Methyltransferase small domain
LERGLSKSLQQMADMIDHHPHDIPAFERVITETSLLLNTNTSLINHPRITLILRLWGVGINRYGIEKALYRFKTRGATSVPSGEISSDLDFLASPDGFTVAESFRRLLEELDLDALNRQLRNPKEGGDYEFTPHAQEDSYISRRDILKQVDNALLTLKESDHLKRVYLAYLLFMEGRPITLDELFLIFGEKRDQLIRYFTTGLFIINKKLQVQMNSLVLSSLTLKGKTIYLLSDRSTEEYKSDRVYLGGDSWTLLKFLSHQKPLSGTGVDLGSGSGIQGIGCVLFHSIEKMILFEIDQRACHVSRFNAVLNGIQNPIEIATTKEDLLAILHSTKVNVITTNPPFMPLPESVELDDHVFNKISSEKVEMKKGHPTVNLKKMFIKAGWGGPDGLTVIKDFLTLAEEIGEKGTRVYIFSPFFPVDFQGKHLLEKFVREKPGWQFQFQISKNLSIPLQQDRDSIHPIKYTKTEAAKLMSETIAKDLVDFLSPSFLVMMVALFQPQIEKDYDSHAVQEFYNGFVIIDL